MFFRKKRLNQESFKLELPEFKEIKPVDLKELSKSKLPKIINPEIKKLKYPRKKELKVKEFKKPELRVESKPKKDKSLLKLKKLDKGYKNDLVDLKRKSKEHEHGFKLISGHMKEQAGKIGELNKTTNSLSKELKDLKIHTLTVSTFDSFSRGIKNRLDALDRLNKEVSRKVALIKDLKTKIDEKYSLNLQMTNQMKERMIELKKYNNSDNQVVQENLNNMMKFMKDLSTAFNNSVSIREEIKKRLVEHDKKIRELINLTERPLDIEEYLRRAEGEK